MLITPVTITVAPLDPASATDDLAREGTLRAQYLDEVTLECQLDYADRSSNTAGLSGGQLVHRAELTVERRAADEAGWEPGRGDLITSITDCEGRADRTALYVQRAIHRGYWFGGASTIVIEADARHPARRAAHP